MARTATAAVAAVAPPPLPPMLPPPQPALLTIPGRIVIFGILPHLNPLEMTRFVQTSKAADVLVRGEQLRIVGDATTDTIEGNFASATCLFIESSKFLHRHFKDRLTEVWEMARSVDRVAGAGEDTGCARYEIAPLLYESKLFDIENEEDEDLYLEMVALLSDFKHPGGSVACAKVHRMTDALTILAVGGNADASYSLTDRDDGANWLTLAYEQGHAQAAYDLSVEAKGDKKSDALLQAAADRKHPEALLELSDRHYDGHYGGSVADNEETSFELFKRALRAGADEGDVVALCDRYETSVAVRRLRCGHEHGLIDCTAALARLLDTKDLECDDAEVYGLFEIACTSRAPDDIAHELGRRCELGLGVPKDIDRAIYWYARGSGLVPLLAEHRQKIVQVLCLLKKSLKSICQTDDMHERRQRRRLV